MKATLSRLLFILLGTLLPVVAPAQTYQDLYSFAPYAGFPASNSDGALPYCALVSLSNTFYGTTYEGGANGEGVVFSVNMNGTQFTNLHTFGALSSGFVGNNSDGAQPYDTLLLSSNVLYGTAYGGGSSSFGTVFRINTDGSAFTNLHSFSDGSGAPKAELILSSNVLYGTTLSGGTGFGSVFRIDTTGAHFTNIHSFTALSNDAFGPAGGLVISGGRLFGTTSGGGSLGAGVVFALGINGQGYTNLFNFQAAPGQGQTSTNNTGKQPYATMLLLGTTLYGTTLYGGTNGNGVLFAISTSGAGFTNLHTFAAGASGATNSDGASPRCSLLLIGTNLYGTAANGGPSGNGTVFSISTNGTGFARVYDFVNIPNTNFTDLGGISPGGLFFANNTLFGTSLSGGGYDGNIYSLNLGIPLSLQNTNGSLVLRWTNPAFSLQSAPAMAGPFTNVPNATSPYTNTPNSSQLFFRLQAD